MAQKVASILAEIGIDASKFQSGANTIGGLLGKIMSGIAGLNPVLGTAGAGFGALAAYMQQAEKAAVESAKADAKLEAILKATGGAAGQTSDELDNLASSLSKTAGIDDELIKSAEGLMLTFRNVAGDTFPRAMQAAIDMQTTFGGLEASTMQLGKALNDPVKGMTALSKAGITFSESQKEQIEGFVRVNDLASAQAIILKEVEAQVGGTAKAINDAGDGSENLQVSLGNLSEVIGERLVPGTRDFNKELTEFIDIISESIGASNKYATAEKEVEEWHRKHSLTLESLLNAHTTLTEYKRNSTYETIRATEYGKAWERVLKDQTTALVEQTAAIETNYDDLLDTTLQNQDAIDRYVESAGKLDDTWNDMQGQIDDLIAQGWSPLSQKVTELKDKQAEIIDQQGDVAEAYEEATSKIELSLIRQKLAADGVFDSLDYQKYLDAAVAMGEMDQASADLALGQDTLAQKFADGKLKADELKKALELLATGKYTIDVILNTVANLAQGKQAQMGGGSMMAAPSYSTATPHAAGGEFLIPLSYGNEGFRMGNGDTASGGERLSLTPRGQSGQGPTMPSFDYMVGAISRGVAEAMAIRGIGG